LGIYSVSARATPVPGEIDVTDNTYMDCIVHVMPRPDIAVTKVTPSKTSVGRGYATSISVTIESQDDYSETFNVTVYVDLNTTVMGDEITIGRQTVTLTRGNSTTITFTWDTSGFVNGNYTISAYAWPVPDETDTTDNNCTDGTVLVTLPGDVNGDKKVDGKDNALMAKYFGKRIGQLGYIPNVDITSDGKIDGKDFAIVNKNVGKRWT